MPVQSLKGPKDMFLLWEERFSLCKYFVKLYFFITPKLYQNYQLSTCQRLHRTNHFSFQTRARCLCQWQAFHCSRPCQVGFLPFLYFCPKICILVFVIVFSGQVRFNISIFLFPKLNLKFGMCTSIFWPSNS